MTRLRPAVLATIALTVMTLVAGCSSANSNNNAGPKQAGTKAKASAPASPSPSPSPKPPPGAPVHASLFQGDGRTYGIGMPIIMRFNRPVTDPTEIEKTIEVTTEPTSGRGAWYWFSKTEAHYRPPKYWPAHATIDLKAPLKGVSAGPGLTFDNDLTLTMRTGPAHVSTIDPNTLRMTVTTDGKVARVLPVSLGKPGHRTYAGVKVVSEKSNPRRMISDPPTGPGSYNLLVPWSVRVTNSGEFVHAAPWNSQVGESSESHGCTNMRPADAQWFYNFSNIGDVVVTSQGSGMPAMRAWDGWGDWNLTWTQWNAG